MIQAPTSASPAVGAVSSPTDAVGRPLSVLIGLEGLALGGCPINALDLGRTLRDRGHHVSVFAIDEDVKVSLLPYADSCGFTPALLPPGVGIMGRSRQIHRLATSVDADITHVFGPWLGPPATVAMAARRSGAAIVTNWTMANVFYTPRHTPVIVGTEHLREELELRHRGPVWLMEPPVDIASDAPDAVRGKEFRRTWGIAPEDVAVVVVGRVDVHLKAEGLRNAIRAVAASADPRLRLVIVGDGDAFEQIRTLADQVNASLGRAAVLLTGSLQDPRPAYDAADIALGMGGSALRALAHGKPLIVLGEGGFARPFDPVTAGYFYRAGFYGDHGPDEPVQHLTILLRSLLDEERRRALAAFGLAEVSSRFSLEAGAARLETIYRSTMEARPGGATRRVAAAVRLARGVAHEGWRTLRGFG